MLVQDHRIASAIMFGRNRIEPGVLVEPAPGADVSGGDPQQLTAFIESIWPTIAEVNARSPAYAQIKREMILVASPDKPLERTPKGTPRRGICLKLYTDEIERQYAATMAANPEQREFPDRM
ncbi:hypothetical protein OH77DRAFT_1222922 [Trametes cingulata]|nr:hypothetical protein OH77DRAFT_1222922 [Trametes cingulata]